jgi:hypothetical protein
MQPAPSYELLLISALTERARKALNAAAAMEDSAAKRMGTVAIILPTCHMVILEDPANVAAVIDEAAKKRPKKKASYRNRSVGITDQESASARSSG